MPFSKGVLGVHSDGLHESSAKRNAANGVAGLDAVSKVPASYIEINTANGIAGLDAGSKVPASFIGTHGYAQHSPTTSSNSATYVGNGAQNRAIAHGLGRRPTYVRIASGSGVTYHQTLLSSSPGIIYYQYGANNGVIAVTNMDDTYFYVGDAGASPGCGNVNAIDYYWVAIA